MNDDRSISIPSRGTSVGKREVEAALAIIQAFLGRDDDVTTKTLKDVAEDLRRSGRRLMWMAKVIEEALAHGRR